MTSTHCDSVLHAEVNCSLECELVNAVVQYLMVVSCLSAGLYCQRSASICGLSLPVCMSAVNNVPVEAQWKKSDLIKSNYLLRYTSVKVTPRMSFFRDACCHRGGFPHQAMGHMRVSMVIHDLSTCFQVLLYVPFTQ